MSVVRGGVIDDDRHGSALILDGGSGPSRRHLQQRADLVSLLVRHTTIVVVAIVGLADGDLVSTRPGWLMLTALGGWGVYRLVTRSPAWQLLAADVFCIAAVGMSTRWLVHGMSSLDSDNVPGIIVSAAIATFVIQLRPAVALPVAVGLVAAYTWGAAHVVGWAQLDRAYDLLALAIAFGAASLIRMLLLRIADAVDRARTERRAAEIALAVTAARRDYDRERLAILHDTAAATLLMVGQGVDVPAERLAAQAGRDLDALAEPPWASGDLQMDLVAAMRADFVHLDTPVHFTGAPIMPLRRPLAAAVVAAAREVTNNVERHANATRIVVHVAADGVRISDDGVGFAVDTTSSGYGIRASIIARMARVGGSGTVRSTPCEGTLVELSWPDGHAIEPPVVGVEADRLISRTRSVFTLAMVGFAVAVLIGAAPALADYTRHVPAQVALAAVSALCALTALPAVLHGERRPAWVAAVVIGVVALVQPMLLTTEELTSNANWSQGAVGYCALPLLLRWPTSRAAAALCAYWAVPAAAALVRDPSEAVVAFLGLNLAGYLVPQIFASLFSTWAFNAAQAARAESDAHMRVVVAERVAEALQSDYVNRYEDVTTGVLPLLEELARGDPVTPDTMRRARAESRRLRALFDQLRADHPLVFEIRALVEAAEDRGADFALHFDADLPPLPPDEVDRLVTAVAQMVALTAVRGRIVVTTAGDRVDVSVMSVTDSDGESRLIPAVEGMNVVSSDGAVWMTIGYHRSVADGGPETVA